MCDFNHEYVFELDYSRSNHQVQLLARCGIVKQFEKIIEFSLWQPFTVIAEFEIICNGRVCQESEDLPVQLSMSCFWIDMLYMMFYYFCHIVVRSMFFISTMSEVAVMLKVERNVSSLCPQSPFAETVSHHFLRFDLTRNCPGARLSIQPEARNAQSHKQ